MRDIRPYDIIGKVRQEQRIPVRMRESSCNQKRSCQRLTLRFTIQTRLTGQSEEWVIFKTKQKIMVIHVGVDQNQSEQAAHDETPKMVHTQSCLIQEPHPRSRVLFIRPSIIGFVPVLVVSFFKQMENIRMPCIFSKLAASIFPSL